MKQKTNWADKNLKKLDRLDKRIEILANKIAVEKAEIARLMKNNELKICDSCYTKKPLSELMVEHNPYGTFYTCIIPCKANSNLYSKFLQLGEN